MIENERQKFLDTIEELKKEIKELKQENKELHKKKSYYYRNPEHKKKQIEKQIQKQKDNKEQTNKYLREYRKMKREERILDIMVGYGLTLEQKVKVFDKLKKEKKITNNMVIELIKKELGGLNV